MSKTQGNIEVLYNKKFELKEIKIVTYEDNKLFLIENSIRPKFQIDLSVAVFNININQKNKQIPSGREHLCFELFYDKIYTFCCLTQEEYDDWMQTLPILTVNVYRTYRYPLACAVTKGKWRFPIPIYRPIEYLLKNKGYLVEGIFRTSASYKTVGKIRQMLDGDQDILLHEFEDNNVAAAVIKDYLKDLPDPLIPCSHYNDFVQIGKMNEKQRFNKARDLVNRLPEVNKNTLWYLIYFCMKVVENVSKNQMNATNLGTCLGPTICRPPSSQSNLEIENTKYVIDAFACLITYYNKIFSDIEHNNVKLGLNPPMYPALVPKPFVPYDQLAEEIKKEAEMKMRRLSQGKPRQTISMKKSGSQQIARDGSELVKQRVKNALNQSGPQIQSLNNSSPVLPPKPNKPPKHAKQASNSNALQGIPHQIDMNSKPPSTPPSKLNDVRRKSYQMDKPLGKAPEPNDIGERPSAPPPRRKTIAQKEEAVSSTNNDLLNKIYEQEKEIEELKKLVDKLNKRLGKQEQVIKHLQEVNEQYYSQQQGYYDENGQYYSNY